MLSICSSPDLSTLLSNFIACTLSHFENTQKKNKYIFRHAFLSIHNMKYFKDKIGLHDRCTKVNPLKDISVFFLFFTLLYTKSKFTILEPSLCPSRKNMGKIYMDLEYMDFKKFNDE